MEGEVVKVRGFIKSPSSILLCSPSNSGKTSLFLELIKFRDWIFENKFEKVILCYTMYQDAYKELENDKQIIFFEGIPTYEHLQEWSLKSENKHVLLVWDDLLHIMLSKKYRSFIEEVFEKYIHHLNYCSLVISQNCFYKNMRHISLNTQYFFLLNYVRDKNQVLHLGRQIFPQTKDFLKIYDDAMKESGNQKHIPPYILLKAHAFDKTFRILTNILPYQAPPVYYHLME